MKLLFQRRPGRTALWLDATPRALNLPDCGADTLGLHLPAASGATLVVTAATGQARLAAPAAGWAVLALPGMPCAIHAEGPPFRLSGGLGEGPEAPACRLWSGAGVIPEAHWRAARIAGEGAVLALAGGIARPFVRLRAGEMARITLPPMALPGPMTPVLTALRGDLPLADLDGLTLTLRAGAFCEILWEDVQLRPNSLANSD